MSVSSLEGKRSGVLARFIATIDCLPVNDKQKLAAGALLLGGSLFFIGNIVHPFITNISNDYIHSEYVERLNSLKGKSHAPEDKAAIWLLGSCVIQKHRLSNGAFPVDKAEQVCLGQVVGQTLLTRGGDAAADVAARYDRLGFSLRGDIKADIGM
ncbi:hypothetical protein [Aeromonas hydrophila]|uniref:hypothetical protein n=1 Tax=Aeromonas hydrophila TaxID=644 RepID=UPI00224CF5F6|nr:hypothetical protein [Aeromonas hydrophila]MCX4117156.1 hypothetical protein [Aeromonas hydrophila]